MVRGSAILNCGAERRMVLEALPLSIIHLYPAIARSSSRAFTFWYNLCTCVPHSGSIILWLWYTKSLLMFLKEIITNSMDPQPLLWSPPSVVPRIDALAKGNLWSIEISSVYYSHKTIQHEWGLWFKEYNKIFLRSSIYWNRLTCSTLLHPVEIFINYTLHISVWKGAWCNASKTAVLEPPTPQNGL